jgi:hypothetical protein
MGPMESPRLLQLGLALALAFAAVQTARLWWARFAPRWRLRRRARRALAAERDAERLLGRAGYRVVDRQVAAALDYGVEGAPVAVTVRADLLVRRGGRTFVAEVKSGQIAPRLRTPATRRQLLEYAHAFDVDGVLLVDPERGRVVDVEVPVRTRAAPPRPGRDLGWLLVGALLGAAATAWWLAAP